MFCLFIAINCFCRFEGLFPQLIELIFILLKINRPTTVALSFNSCLIIVRQLLDDNATVVGRLIIGNKDIVFSNAEGRGR